MRLNKLILAGSTGQSKARKNNLERLVDAIISSPNLPLEKAIETYLPKKKWPRSFSRFIQRNKAILEAIYRSKPEIGTEITFKSKANNLGNWINLKRLVTSQMYQVYQTSNGRHFKNEDFTAKLEAKHFILGFPYLVFEGDKKIDVCFGSTIFKAI